MQLCATDIGHEPDLVFQFTEEKLGQAEKTELDPHLENLITRADGTKNWTEKILKQTEVLLQPNPSKGENKYVKRPVASYRKVTSAPASQTPCSPR